MVMSLMKAGNFVMIRDVVVVKMMVTYPLLRVPMPRTPGCEQRRLSDNTHVGRGGGVESVKPIIAEDINMVDNKPGSPPSKRSRHSSLCGAGATAQTNVTIQF